MSKTAPTAQPSIPPLAAPQPITFQAARDTRLDQLLVEYDLLKPKVDHAKDQLKTLNDRLELIKDGIKAETSRQYPGQEVVLTSPSLSQPLRFYLKQATRVDLDRLKELFPQVRQQCLKVTTSWNLERL